MKKRSTKIFTQPFPDNVNFVCDKNPTSSLKFKKYFKSVHSTTNLQDQKKSNGSQGIFFKRIQNKKNMFKCSVILPRN